MLYANFVIFAHIVHQQEGNLKKNKTKRKEAVQEKLKDKVLGEGTQCDG